MPAVGNFCCCLSSSWECVQNEADAKAKSGSNALASARAWIQNRTGGWAGILAAAGVALVGTELLKRCAGAALGPVMGHYAGIQHY